MQAQRPRIDLTKGSYPDQILPEHRSLYPIGLISGRNEILHGGNFLSKMSLNVNIVKLFWHYLVSKNKFLKNLCIGGFKFLLILDIWGIS